MFTVNPAPISEVEAYLKPYSAKLQDIWRLLPATAGGTTPKKQRPFVQLAAHEIPEEQEEEVFDYAGISFASNPIGLPLNIEPRTFGDDPRQRIVALVGWLLLSPQANRA